MSHGSCRLCSEVARRATVRRSALRSPALRSPAPHSPALRTLALLSLGSLATPAFAYVGPGAGLGFIGTLFGIAAALILAMIGLFWYPLKRAFGKKQAVAEGDDAGQDDDARP